MKKRTKPAPKVLAPAAAPRDEPRGSGLLAGGVFLVLGFAAGPNVAGVVDSSVAIELVFTAAASFLLFYVGARTKLVHSREEQPFVERDYRRASAVSAVALVALLLGGVDYKTAFLLSALAGVAGIGPGTTIPTERERLHVLVTLGGVLLLSIAGTGQFVPAAIFIGAAVLILLVGQYRYAAVAGALLRRLSPTLSLCALAGVILALMFVGAEAGLALPLSAFLGGLLIRRCPFSLNIFVETPRLRSAATAGFLFGLGLLVEGDQIGAAAAIAAGLFVLQALVRRVFASRRSPDLAIDYHLRVPGLISLLWLSTLYGSAGAYIADWGLIAGVAALLISVTSMPGLLGRTRHARAEHPNSASSEVHSLCRSTTDHAQFLGTDVTALRLMEVADGSTMDGARLRCTSFWREFHVYVHTVWRGDAVLDLSEGLTVRAGDSVLLSGTPERLVALAPLFECSFFLPSPGS